MIGLYFATSGEAQPSLEQLSAEKLSDEPCPLYRFASAQHRPGGVVIIGGVGKEKAASACEHLIEVRGATTVINVGICGALTDDAQPGEVFRVHEVHDGDAILADGPDDAHTCDAGAWSELPARALASLTKPVFESDRRSKLALHSALVDMEGWGVAEACLRHGVRFCLLKGVTDRAGSTGKAEIRENLKWVSSRLAEVVLDGLGRLPRTGVVPLKNLHRFTRVQHTLLSLPLLFAGAWLGTGGKFPSWSVLGLITLAGVGARTVGMSLNRIFDRDLDALNKRTAGRELPSGRMSLGAAWSVAGVGLALYLLACVGLGRICVYLSIVPLVPLTLYSLLKRFTRLCHFGIGLCLAMAPSGAFVAASGSVNPGAEIWLLTLFAFCWVSGFDIIYALLDIESDRQTGVHSLPASLGGAKAQAVAVVVHAVAAVAIGGVWWLGGRSLLAGVALGVAVCAMAVAYVQRIPAGLRFFPTSAIAGIAGSAVPMLGGLG